jgi:hypothetical protein
MQCFQKDPNLRVSAKKLLRHAWIVGSRRNDAPVPRAPSAFSQAVEEVKQWNKALESSENNLRVSTGSENGPPNFGPPLPAAPTAGRLHNAAAAKGPLVLAKPKPVAEAFKSPELADDDNWDNDFATAISPTAFHLPLVRGQDNFGGKMSGDRLKALASIDAIGDESQGFNESELKTIKLSQWMEDQEQTIRPFPKKVSQERPTELKPPLPVDKSAGSRSRQDKAHRRQKSNKALSLGPQIAAPPVKSPTKAQFGGKFELPPRPDVIYREQATEDYSDLFADNDSVFNQKLNLVTKDTPQLFHPSDLTSLPRSTQSPIGGSMKRVMSSRPSVLPDRPMRRTKSDFEIEKYAEDQEDEDFSDIFGPEETLTEKEESDRGSEDGQQLMNLSKLSHNSWLGDDEDDDDPFAVMDPGWDEMDLETNLARDRHARLAEKVEDMVKSLKTIEGEDLLSDLAEDLLSLLWENGDVKNLIISAHGLLPILEILEPCTVKSRQMMILHWLKIVNAVGHIYGCVPGALAYS